MHTHTHTHAHTHTLPAPPPPPPHQPTSMPPRWYQGPWKRPVLRHSSICCFLQHPSPRQSAHPCLSLRRRAPGTYFQRWTSASAAACSALTAWWSRPAGCWNDLASSCGHSWSAGSVENKHVQLNLLTATFLGPLNNTQHMHIHTQHSTHAHTHTQLTMHARS